MGCANTKAGTAGAVGDIGTGEEAVEQGVESGKALQNKMDSAKGDAAEEMLNGHADGKGEIIANGGIDGENGCTEENEELKKSNSPRSDKKDDAKITPEKTKESQDKFSNGLQENGSSEDSKSGNDGAQQDSKETASEETISKPDSGYETIASKGDTSVETAE